MEYGWGQVSYFQRVRRWHAISGYYPGTFSTQIWYVIFIFNMLRHSTEMKTHISKDFIG